MTDILNRILRTVQEQENKIDQLLKISEKNQEEILTSEQVCVMLDIGRTQLTHLDKLAITEPIFLEDNSKKKYYLRSQIINVFIKKQHRKRWKD